MRLFNTATDSRRRLVVTLAVIVLVAVAVAVAVAVSRSHRSTVSQTGAAGEYRACLVSTTHDATTADPTWQAIQAARSGIVINTQRTVISAKSPGTQVSDLNSVLGGHCELVITVGSYLHDAVTTVATDKPGQQFLSIGSTVGLPNVHDLSAVPVPTAEITKFVRRAAQSYYGGTSGVPAPPVTSQGS